MSEPGEHSQKANILVESLMGNQANRDKLLAKNNRAVVTQLKDTFLKLGEANTLQTTLLLFDELVKPDDLSNQDRRDTSNVVLAAIPFSKFSTESRKQVLSEYEKRVQKLNTNNDVYGSTSSLLDAGKVITTAFTPSLQGVALSEAFREPWQRYIGTLSDPEEKEYVQSQVDISANRLLPPPAPEKLNDRDEPTFELDQRELYDYYRETSRKNGSIKLDLWSRVPTFRNLVSEQGVDLARFWNTTDPQMAKDFLRDIKEQPEDIRLRFSKNLQKSIGASLDSLTDTHVAVVSDQIMEVGRILVDDLDKPGNSFSDSIAGMDDLIQRAKTEGVKNKKSYFQGITSFFKRYASIDLSSDISSMEEAFKNLPLMEKAEKAFEDEKKGRKDVSVKLREAYPSLQDKSEFTLMDRGEKSLFLGDLTGDCTAFHLNVGFNAWTLPSWLTDPGFNFLKITDGEGNFFGKAGMYLGVKDGNTPTLIIDSFELSSQVDDKNREYVREHTEKALHFLKEWAGKNSISQVMSTTIANSDTLRDVLSKAVDSKIPNPEDTLVLMGGLSGVEEVRTSLGKPVQIESSYVQSSVDQQGAGFEDHTVVQDKLMQIETSVRHVLARLSRSGAEDFLQHCKDGDWNHVFNRIMKDNYSFVHTVLGGDWDQYKSMLAPSPNDPLNKTKKELIDEKLEKTMKQKLADSKIEHFYPDPADGMRKNPAYSYSGFTNYGIELVENASTFLTNIADLSMFGISPREALSRIYKTQPPIGGEDTSALVSSQEDIQRINRNKQLIPNLGVFQG
ncbi:MAG: hypothetical protein KBC00_02350 [Candidatus Levybacteria bacterium]|nr:hypothetical protein [Candidatus Levybacteria bacterium]MBP9815416.1 hypothetical protein [Candidatus Levybacteria bacterium]